MVTQVPPDEMHLMYQLLWKRVNRLLFEHEVLPQKKNIRLPLPAPDHPSSAEAAAPVGKRLAAHQNSRSSGVPKRGPIRAQISLPKSKVLDSRLILVSTFFRPCDFQRDLTVSAFFKEYKCSQFRQLGLYVGYGIYEGLVDERYLRLWRYLKAFNMLVLGMSGNPPSTADLDVAQVVIEYFVSEYMRLRAAPLKDGEVISVPYCLHLALHVVRYVRTLNVSFGKLSAFGYENFLRELVPALRTTNRLLEQLVNRQQRRDLYVLNRNADNTIMRDDEGRPLIGWGGWKGNSKIVNGRKFSLRDSGKFPIFQLNNLAISTKFADSWVLVCSNSEDPSTYANPLIFRCVEFVRGRSCLDEEDDSNPSDIFVRGYFYPEKSDLYADPFQSSLKLEFCFKNEHTPQLAELPIESVLFKLYVYPRFSSMPVEVLTAKHLGEDFENVPEWIGVALRH
jgi:hypothetical protein